MLLQAILLKSYRIGISTKSIHLREEVIGAIEVQVIISKNVFLSPGEMPRSVTFPLGLHYAKVTVNGFPVLIF